MSQSQSRFPATAADAKARRSKVWRAGAVAAVALVAFPGLAEAECVTQPGRVLMSPAAPAAGAVAPRAAMLRAGAGGGSAAAAAGAGPQVARAQKPASVRRASATGKRKAGRAPAASRPRAVAAGRRAAGKAPVAAAKPTLRPVVAPVPMLVAAQELAVPKAYALVALTVCHSGVIEPFAAPAPDVSGAGLPVFDEGLLDDVWTGVEGPVDPFVGVKPGPPRLVDPTSPGPALPGDVGAIPEPSTWAMMIGGFGLIGAALRRRRRIACRP